MRFSASFHRVSPSCSPVEPSRAMRTPRTKLPALVVLEPSLVVLLVAFACIVMLGPGSKYCLDAGSAV